MIFKVIYDMRERKFEFGGLVNLIDWLTIESAAAAAEASAAAAAPDWILPLYFAHIDTCDKTEQLHNFNELGSCTNQEALLKKEKR